VRRIYSSGVQCGDARLSGAMTSAALRRPGNICGFNPVDYSLGQGLLAKKVDRRSGMNLRQRA